MRDELNYFAGIFTACAVFAFMSHVAAIWMPCSIAAIALRAMGDATTNNKDTSK